jgi:hypothetical protein
MAEALSRFEVSNRCCLQLRRDEKWLARASDAIAAYWRQRNARKRSAGGRNGGGSR